LIASRGANKSEIEDIIETMSKVLITGVAGFLGSHLADSFIAKGYEVVGIDNLIGGYKENVPLGVDFHEIDLSDLEKLHEPLTGVDLVVHTACTAYEGLSVFSPALVTKNTSHITTTLLSASIMAGVKKFVHLSSMARYGTQETLPFVESMTPKPQDPYGIAKYSAEMLVKNISETHGMQYVILVPHNIIGPRQKFDDPYRNVASIMINRMLQGKQPIIYGNGEQKRCFSFIQDVTSPLMFACENDLANGKIINIGPDEEFITINQLGKLIAEILNFENYDPIYMPGRPQEVFHANCSANLARELLNYRTQTTLREGLTDLVEWIRSKGAREFSYHLPIEILNDRTPKTWSQKLM
jgi:UDP-glucose 4-epimerase